MKKLFTILVFCSVFVTAKAEEIKFSYTAQADLTSCFIWRGLYNGGLSFQPDLAVGWESEHTAFSFGTWWNAGASDWGFRKNLPVTEDCNPNTKFIPEVDVYASLNLWGAVMGFTHYYYFDGENFFNFGDINSINGSAQTEVTLGYDFSTLLPNVDLQLMWNTMVSGDDCKIDGKRCYSSYLEASYTQHFKHDISLKGVIGVSPWRSIYTDGNVEGQERDWAFNNLTLRLDKSWELADGLCSLDVFLQGTMNTCNLNKDNAFISASGDNKLSKQKLMGAVGVSIAF